MAEKTFTNIKWAFTFAPNLAHLNLSKIFLIEAYTFDFAFRIVLLKLGDNGQQVAFTHKNSTLSRPSSW